MFGMSADRIKLGLFGDTTSLVCVHDIQFLGQHGFLKPHELVDPPLEASRSQEFRTTS